MGDNFALAKKKKLFKIVGLIGSAETKDGHLYHCTEYSDWSLADIMAEEIDTKTYRSDYPCMSISAIKLYWKQVFFVFFVSTPLSDPLSQTDA